MKFVKILAIASLLGQINSIKLKISDEVDDIIERNDQNEQQESLKKEFDNAGSKMNQIGNVSKQHSTAEDEDYMKSVFDKYSKVGKDKRGNPNGMDILTKEGAREASLEIIMKWNELPEQNV